MMILRTQKGTFIRKRTLYETQRYIFTTLIWIGWQGVGLPWHCCWTGKPPFEIRNGDEGQLQRAQHRSQHRDQNQNRNE